MKNFPFRAVAALLLIAIACSGCKPSTPTPPVEKPEGEYAVLFNHDWHLAPGQKTRLFWVTADHDLEIVYERSELLKVSVSEADDKTPPEGEVKFTTTESEWEALEMIQIKGTGKTYYIRLGSKVPEKDVAVEAALRYVNEKEAFSEAGLAASPMLKSPVRAFPSGNMVTAVPEGLPYKTLREWVKADFGMDFRGPASQMMLFVWAEDLIAEYLDAIKVPPVPPAAGGPTPPDSATHRDNYCGISVFIHSMHMYFPGALPASPNSDPNEWDEVGDNLDHSNTFGERGGKLVSRVNEKYRDGNGSRNGKKYCAAELDDTSLENLKRYALGCNVKLLIYDLPEFGHWVDVIGFNGNNLIIQDYGDRYEAEYDEANENVDFSRAGGSTTGSEFDASDPICGDGPLETVSFFVVCECDSTPDGPAMPTVNGNGEPLKE